MSKETKAIVAFEESFAKLDIRVGRIIEVDLETRLARLQSAHAAVCRTLSGWRNLCRKCSKSTSHPRIEVH